MLQDGSKPTVCRVPGPGGWVVPGPLRQVTGGYLYDARVVDRLRDRGWPIGVIDLRSNRWPLDPAAGRRLISALRSQTWAAVVIDELAHPAVAAAVLAGGLRPALRCAPLVLLVHHLRCSEPGHPPMRALAHLVERLVARAADLIVCTSETTARTVRPLTRPGTPVEVIRPGWDTHSPLPLARARERGAGGEGLSLLLVGHWTPRKGILDGLAALARLPVSIALDLVGEQDRDLAYAARVRAALDDPALAGRVRVHGRVSDDVLAGMFADADALILPSTHEGYGMVLAEALAAGLPIVATRVGAVAEVVRDGFEAELVPPGDVGALTRAVERLLADPDERRRRSALARERARTLPRWSESVAAFDSLLHGLATPALAAE
jgi:glycosyltransferase involved in cell wall biosynthesis